jgi:hypothetical protein
LAILHFYFCGFWARDEENHKKSKLFFSPLLLWILGSDRTYE